MHESLSTRMLVSLPGGVKKEGQWFREAELCPLTGREEDWLVRNPASPAALSVTRLLSGCLLRLGDREVTTEGVRQLLVGDRDFLVLNLRRLTMGDNFYAVVNCPSCGKKMDVSFKTTDVPVETPEKVEASYELRLAAESDRQRTIHFRLPTGADQEAVLGVSPDDALGILLDRCLVDDGGLPLDHDERQHLENAIESRAPKVDLELALTCPDCEQKFVFPFDTTAFFLQELRSNGRNLLREIHSLAFYYHWSESEILNLDRERRRTYLSLLTDELRGA
jgi:hypothetical protein